MAWSALCCPAEAGTGRRGSVSTSGACDGLHFSGNPAKRMQPRPGKIRDGAALLFGRMDCLSEIDDLDSLRVGVQDFAAVLGHDYEILDADADPARDIAARRAQRSISANVTPGFTRASAASLA